MKLISKWINRTEKRYLSKLVRKSLLYNIFKAIVISPLLLVALISKTIFKILPKQKGDLKQSTNKLMNIISGFANLSFPNEQVEAMAMKRAAICSECPAAEKTSIYSVVVDNRTKDIQGMKCGDCGCNLSAKVRSERDNCPRGKW